MKSEDGSPPSSPPITEAQARLDKKLEELKGDPDAQAAFAAIREAQEKQKVMPLPASVLQDAREHLESLEKKKRQRTRRDVIAQPLEARAITKQIAVVEQDDHVVETVERLPSAARHEPTQVSSHRVRLADEAARQSEDARRKKPSFPWIWIAPIGVVAVGILIWIGWAASTAATTPSAAPSARPTSPPNTGAPIPTNAATATNAAPSVAPTTTEVAPTNTPEHPTSTATAKPPVTSTTTTAPTTPTASGHEVPVWGRKEGP